jgi:cold shock protein
LSNADRPSGRRWVAPDTIPYQEHESIDRHQGVLMAAMNGTIKRIVSDKGFGFILGSDGQEYFFHNSACRDTRFDSLREGQAVTFEKGQGPKGPRGENVRAA